MIKAMRVMVLLVLLLCSGCIGQREQQLEGEFLFENTGLVLQLPENWQAVVIPGSEWPLLATEIDYGIRPNIRLLRYSSDPSLTSDVESFLAQEQKADSSYRVVTEENFPVGGFLSGLKVTAKRKNSDNIPIIHFSYILRGEQGRYILYATCAEPGLVGLEPLFDGIIRSAQIRM